MKRSGSSAAHWLRRAASPRLLQWALAIVALAVVVAVVPVRDRCWDPRAPSSTRAPVSRVEGGACVLRVASGDVTLDASECAQLRCEPGVRSTLSRTNLGVVALMMVVYALGTLVWAARWRALLAFAGVDLPLGRVWRLSIEAQAGGVVLPGGIGGDAFRVASVIARPERPGDKRAPAAIVVASVLLDRAIGLSAIAAIAATLGFAWGGLSAGPLAFALAAIPVGFLVAIVVLRRAPLDRLRGRFVQPVLQYVRDPRAPRAIASAAALSVLVALAQFAVLRGFVVALGATPAAEKWIYVGAAMAFIVGALPLLPGGWGTQDAAYVFFFGDLAGLGSSVALSVCLLFRLFWYLSGVVGAILVAAGPRVRAAPVAHDMLKK